MNKSLRKRGGVSGRTFWIGTVLSLLMLLLPLSSALADSSGTPIPGNLVVNGSFEQNPDPDANFMIVVGSTPMPGWTQQSGCGTEFWGHGFIRTPDDGHFLLELDANCNGIIEQSVPTVAGQQYELRYSFSARPGTSIETNALRVLVNGVEVSFVNAISSDFSTWRQFSHGINATGSTTTLRFEGVGSNDALGSLLDNVSLVPLTPPNQSPTVNAGGAYQGSEGTPIAVSGATASDPDVSDTLTYNWSVNSALCSFDNPGALNPNLICSDNGNFTATLEVSDGVNHPVTSDANVTIDNVAPTITSLVAGAAAACGQSNSVTINFYDPALANDTYTAIIDWGDGNSDTYSSVSSGFAPSHAYSLAGQYTVAVTVSDEDGGLSASASTTLALNFTIAGILQPLNQDGSSVFKYNSTIPIKINVADCDRSFPDNLTISISLLQLSGNAPNTPINEPSSTSAADTTGFMRFTGSPNNQYSYNLASKPLPDPSASYKITLTIAQTGQTVTVNFGLRP